MISILTVMREALPRKQAFSHKVLTTAAANCSKRFVDLHALLPNADSKALLLRPKVCLQDSQAVLMEAQAYFTEDKQESTETTIPSHTVARQYVP